MDKCMKKFLNIDISYQTLINKSKEIFLKVILIIIL